MVYTRLSKPPCFASTCSNLSTVYVPGHLTSNYWLVNFYDFLWIRGVRRMAIETIYKVCPTQETNWGYWDFISFAPYLSLGMQSPSNSFDQESVEYFSDRGNMLKRSQLFISCICKMYSYGLQFCLILYW